MICPNCGSDQSEADVQKFFCTKCGQGYWVFDVKEDKPILEEIKISEEKDISQMFKFIK